MIGNYSRTREKELRINSYTHNYIRVKDLAEIHSTTFPEHC
jgi:hypothetical protein